MTLPTINSQSQSRLFSRCCCWYVVIANDDDDLLSAMVDGYENEEKSNESK